METNTKQSITTRLAGGYPDACRELKREPLSLEQFLFLPGDQGPAIFALHKILTMVEAVNEGHLFNWNSYKEYKWFPIWDMETYGDAPAGSGFRLIGVVYVSTDTAVGARLVTRSQENSKFVAEIMEPEYKVWIKK